jgi:hypothetical protein
MQVDRAAARAVPAGPGGGERLVAVPSAALLGIRRGAVIGAGAAGAAARPAGSAEAGGGPANTLALRDLLAVMERDPVYCRHPQLYRLHTMAAQAATRK